jgi:pyruvate dehydrogenase E1 component alpha subunit
MNIDDISIRASSYGIKGIALDGNDVLLIYEETKRAREYILANGPMLMVLNTYRWMGHSKSDPQLYRTKEEVNQWKEKCPIKSYREHLKKEKLFTQKELDNLDKKAQDDIAASVVFADSSPELPIERIFDDVYATGDMRTEKHKKGFVL